MTHFDHPDRPRHRIEIVFDALTGVSWALLWIIGAVLAWALLQ